MSAHVNPYHDTLFIPPGCNAGQEDEDEILFAHGEEDDHDENGDINSPKKPSNHDSNHSNHSTSSNTSITSCSFGPLHFGDTLDANFHCPSRLERKNLGFMECMSDWHVPMLKDSGRNDFYWNSLKKAIGGWRVRHGMQHGMPAEKEKLDAENLRESWKTDSNVNSRGPIVVDIGAGSGLLSLMAVKLGASRVFAIEGNATLCRMIKKIAKTNGIAAAVRRSGYYSGSGATAVADSDTASLNSGVTPDSSSTPVLEIIHDLSSNVALPEELKADIIVSETLGALLNSEGMVDYLHDGKERLGKNSDCVVIPAVGVQTFQLIQSDVIEEITTVGNPASNTNITNSSSSTSSSTSSTSNSASWRSLDLSPIAELRDTCTLQYSKQYGFTLNSVPDLKYLSVPVNCARVDFGYDSREVLLKRSNPDGSPYEDDTLLLSDGDGFPCFPVRIEKDGIVHGVMAFWTVGQRHDDIERLENVVSDSDSSDSSRELSELSSREEDGSLNTKVISTHPEATRSERWGFARDMHWGQALQLVEDLSDSSKQNAGRPIHVKEGDVILVSSRFSSDGQGLQFGCRRMRRAA